MRAALRRIVAFLIDWLCILGWVAVTAAVGVPLYLGGVTRGLDTVALNVIATVVLVIPVVVAAAVFESRRRAATPASACCTWRCATDPAPPDSAGRCCGTS
ncbi:hypothetical protein GCM10025881_01540 [Pseudolysinimonas kribbensis]|uniref:RDD domain-containing protein n=1 Tax=Pseudolysinimonas kribbensis TaxID=433641 RepID=A0ABQ6JYE1_9MICO|nr:hypothetical protein GCM10025881_01540 [Pseudolysinimonas kribbensis]